MVEALEAILGAAGCSESFAAGIGTCVHTGGESKADVAGLAFGWSPSAFCFSLASYLECLSPSPFTSVTGTIFAQM